jgi:hypothetical protein
MDKGLQIMGSTLNNLLIAIRAVEAQQKVSKNPSVWQSLEDELIDLREKVEKLEHGTT